MEIIKRINPFWGFIAAILGWTLYKHFDFTSFKFADPYFDTVYFIVFVISIYFLIIEYKKQAKK
jgi:membrane protein DedA with SNARE-associated domain